MSNTLRIDAENFCAIAFETLSRGISLRFQANGQSMLPHIADGDILTVAPINKRGLKLGDIIMHRAENSNALVVHRIIRTSPRRTSCYYHTRGDAFGGIAERVKEENVLGRIISVEHNGTQTELGSPSERLKSMLWVYRQTLRHLCHTTTLSPKNRP